MIHVDRTRSATSHVEGAREIEATCQRALAAEKLERSDEIDRFITRLVDAAMSVEPGRRDVDLYRAERDLRKHLGLKVPK